MPTKDELSTPSNACVTRFVKLTLHFECFVQQVLERLLISVAQESHALVHLGGTQYVAETDVLEAKHVSHIVVVWQVTKKEGVRVTSINARMVAKTYMPAGMPEVANATTSSEVKSGFMKVSLWYSRGQGMSFKYFSALSTRRPNFALISLLTTDTKPSHSARTPND